MPTLNNRPLSVCAIGRPARDSVRMSAVLALVANPAIADPAPDELTVGDVPVTFQITSHDGVAIHDEGAVTLSGEVTFGGASPSGGTALVLALDVSASMVNAYASGCAGDLNGDGVSDTVLDCQIQAALSLATGSRRFGSISPIPPRGRGPSRGSR